MELTPNYGLKKPAGTNTVNIGDLNDNADIIDTKLKTLDTEVAETKKSVSDGKTLLAAAITAKKVAAAATDTFAQLAAKIGQIVLGSGNATPPDVAAGKTFTNSTGVEQTGTMPNRGNVSYSLPINGTYTIEAGQHGGGGKVTQSIPTLGAQTINPGTTAKTLSSSGKYMTGNVIVPAVSIAAAYIKKGQVITFPDGSTVTGTWEGYVANPTDLYYNGANAASCSVGGGLSIEATQITVTSSSAGLAVTFNKTYDVTGYTQLIVEGSLRIYNYAHFYLAGTQSGTQREKITTVEYGSTYSSITIDISQETGIVSGSTRLYMSLFKDSYIKRIRIA